MTAIEAYILAKKIALGAVSGIANITFNEASHQIIFNFKDGSSSGMTIPLPQDGVSIINVEIDNDKHLICTLSNGSTIDAGELPGGTGGGLIQVPKFSSLTVPGQDNTLYLTKDDEALYYWDTTSKKYQPITTGGGSIDFKTSSIVFDGVETTFDLPIDDKELNIYVNGMYLTRGEDYTINRAVTPNQVTFLETWENTDLCTLTWATGGGGGSSGEGDTISLATIADIDAMFKEVV